MTRGERLRRCYQYEEVDRPAVYSRTGFPGDDPTYDRLKAYLLAHTEQKVGWSSGRFESSSPTRSVREAHSEDWERRITVLETPAGELTSSRLVSLKGQPGLHERYLVNSREEAQTYLSLPLPTVDGDVSDFFVARDQIAEVGVAEVALGFNSGGFAAELCGSENFAVMSITDRDIVHALCERQLTILSNRVKFLLENGLGPFFSIAGQEYIVPPLHGWSDFCDFNVKYDKPIIDLIHDAGGRVHVHCHGSMQAVIQGFIDMDVDVLHPFEPPPMGDITAAEAKAHARGRLCLEGNTQINRMYEATPDEIREETGALILCPTASPYIRGEGEACFPQYKALIDTVLEWKR